MTLPVFPALSGLAFPITRKVSFETARERSVSGKTARYPRASRPKWTWTVEFEFLRQNYHGVTGELATLYGFFASLYGAAYPFLFTDPDDNAVTTAVFGTGDAISTQFQLARSFGGFSEPVYAPTGTPTIYVAGVPAAGGSYSISATGLVTFTSAPALGAALTWTGTFSWLCELDEDLLETDNIMRGLYVAKRFSFSNKLL